MLYLIIAIFCSGSLILLFKILGNISINTFHCIVINYFTAASLGYVLLKTNINWSEIPFEPWFPFTLLMGLLFILTFYVIALTTQKNGITVAAVSNNMSLVIPVFFAVILYDDNLNFIKIIAIILSLVGVLLTSIKNENTPVKNGVKYLPFILFLGSGLVWTILNYIEKSFLNDSNGILFVPTIFAIAGLMGALIIVPRILAKKTYLSAKEIGFGIIIGTINFCSIYFFVLALHSNFLESSEIIPIGNLGAVFLSTIFAYFLFKEEILPKNWAGLLISAIAILMIAFNGKFLIIG